MVHPKQMNDDFVKRLEISPQNTMVVCEDMKLDQKEVNIKECLIRHGMKIINYSVLPYPVPLKSKIKSNIGTVMVIGIVDKETVYKICKESWISKIYGCGSRTGMTSSYL
jgi:hypothetical protein